MKRELDNDRSKPLQTLDPDAALRETADKQWRKAVASGEPPVADGANPPHSKVLTLLEEGGADIVEVSVGVFEVDGVNVSNPSGDVGKDGGGMEVVGKGGCEELLRGGFVSRVEFGVQG